MADVTGIVLAAGAGTRAGGPKALLRLPDGTPWISVATSVLLEAGCQRVVVVLGALAKIAPPDPQATVVIAADWADGMAASLRAGLDAATGDAALITLVDLPDLPVSVAKRLIQDASAHALAQAVYDGSPGHPVLIGSDHWQAVSDSLTGDRGARAYLVAHGVREVECADLWDGLDRDRG